MISAQTLCVCRKGKPLHTFPDHALGALCDTSAAHDAALLQNSDTSAFAKYVGNRPNSATPQVAARLPCGNGGILFAEALAPMDMKRRDFILAAIGAAASLSKAQAQQTSAVLAVLGSASQQAVRTNFGPAKARLAEMGLVEGRNLIIEYHGADDQLDRLPTLAADLVKRRVSRDCCDYRAGNLCRESCNHIHTRHFLYRL